MSLMTPQELKRMGITKDNTLSDETNGEFFKRIDLLYFMGWMRRNKHDLPTTVDQANRTVSAYLQYEREAIRTYLQQRDKKGQKGKRKA